MAESFDDYCERKEIKPGEEPAAFAAYLHEISGGEWDGKAEPYEPVQPSPPMPVYYGDPRGYPMVMPPGEDPLGPSRGCLIGILLGATIWLVILLILWATGVIG